MIEAEPTLSVRRIGVQLADGRTIVDDVGFDICAGEILCLVGESGSGKTTLSTALLGYVRAGARIVGGSVVIDGVDLLSCAPGELRGLRGRAAAYIAQDPVAAFNPAMRIGEQMCEVAGAHGVRRRDAEARALEVLDDVGLPATKSFLARFAHQLSGGQLQRVGIAIALMLQPRVVIFDEPTTGLDAANQARFLALVRRLCTDKQIAVLYVTHDLSVVARIADRTLVMLAGQAVEQGSARQLFVDPGHAYTRQLLAAAPDIACAPVVKARRSVETADPLLRITDLWCSYSRDPVLRGVSFEVHRGECLAIVGESGSGKSTLSKCIVGQHPADRAEIAFEGEVLAARAGQRSLPARRKLQYIFQSPYSSLNPRRTIGESIALAHEVVIGGTRAERGAAVAAVMTKVGLSPDRAGQYPSALSGGERQRAAIARALVIRPTMLICDEITSALDTVVQEAIFELLNDLRRTEQLAIVFVTHSLAVVRRLADRVLVLNRGQVVEIGATEDILDRPGHPFTRKLMEETLSITQIARDRWSSAR